MRHRGPKVAHNASPRRHLAAVSTQSGLVDTSVVRTVAGRTGVVTLTAADVGAGTFPGDVVLTSTSTGTTQTAANSTTRFATTAFATTADNLKANLASPTLTGTVTTPNGAGATDLAAYGQLPTAGSVGGTAKVAFRTGDSTPITNNATAASDDTLTLAVGASDRWWIEVWAVFTAADSSGAAATADIKVGWSVPASGAMMWGNMGTPSSTFIGYGWTGTVSGPNALKTAAQTTTGGAAAVAFGVYTSGFYTGGGTGGTVAFQWAQATSNAATLQINKNSVLIAYRVV